METPFTAHHLESAKSTGLRVEVARSPAVLAAYEAAWNRLALEAPYCPPAQLGTWLITHLEETAPMRGENWFCLLALEEDQLVGVLPLVLESHRVAGFRWTRLTTPQKGEVFSVDLLTARGREGEVIPLFLETLGREHPSLRELVLPRVPELSPALAFFRRAPRNTAPGYVLLEETGGRGSYLKVSASYAEYAKTLRHNFSRNLTKARNKLAGLPDVRTVFLTGAEADERQLGRFLEVEAAGWKGQGHSAIRDKPALLGFYRALARRLGKLGWLEWHFLMSGDRTLAGHLAVKLNRRLILYKIGYDEDYARCAPGNLLLERALQRAFASDDTDEVDCLTDCPWHDNWAMEKRAFYDVRLYPRRLLPLVTGAWARRARTRWRKVPWLRQFYQHLRNPIRSGEATAARGGSDLAPSRRSLPARANLDT